MLANMWTLWKTQDWSVPSLWITDLGRLLGDGASGRIGGVATPLLTTLGTFKTPVQTAYGRSCTSEASVLSPVVIHSVPGEAGASSSLIHRTLNGTRPERRSGARYTVNLTLRLLRESDARPSFPHLWKGLWRSWRNRRSAALMVGRSAKARIYGYAPEQVFVGSIAWDRAVDSGVTRV